MYVLFGDSQNRVHVGGLPEKVDGDDGLGPRRDGGLELRGIHGARCRGQCRQKQVRPRKGDGLGRGDEGRWHRDNLITGADAQGKQAQPDGVGTVADADGMLGVAEGGK